MTNTDRIRYITAGLAIAGTVLAIGSTLTGIPGLPGWLVSSWPIVYGVALAFDRVAHILWSDIPAPDVNFVPPANVHLPVSLTTRSEPITLSSDVLHETPDTGTMTEVTDALKANRPRVGQVDPHNLASAVIEAQAGVKS